MPGDLPKKNATLIPGLRIGGHKGRDADQSFQKCCLFFKPTFVLEDAAGLGSLWLVSTMTIDRSCGEGDAAGLAQPIHHP